MSPDPCPSPGTLLRWHDADDPALQRHLDRCATCRAALTELTDLLASTRTVLLEECAAGAAARRQRFETRLGTVVASDVPRRRPPARSRVRVWWRRWWPVPATLAAGITVALLLVLRPSEADAIIRAAVEADARAAFATAPDERQLHVRAVPSDPRVSGCEPWATLLPFTPTPQLPSMAVDLLQDFFAAPDGLVWPHATLSASFDAWRQRATGWASHEDVFRDSRVRVVSTAAVRGLLQRAELTVRWDTGALVRVALIGDGCRVVITPVASSPAPRREGMR